MIDGRRQKEKKKSVRCFIGVLGRIFAYGDMVLVFNLLSIIEHAKGTRIYALVVSYGLVVMVLVTKRELEMRSIVLYISCMRFGRV